MVSGPIYNGFGFLVGATGLYLCINGPSAWYTSLAGGLLIVCGGTSWFCNEVRWTYNDEQKAKALEAVLASGRSDADFAEAGQKAWDAKYAPKEKKPKIYVDGKPVLAQEYLQDVTAVRLERVDRSEQYVAQTLVDQRDLNGGMNISESFWLRDGHWKDGPDSFRNLRNKWEFYKIVGKRGAASNSRYQVENERAVELIADGRLILPPPI
jgi:hypothetical protein